MAERLVLVDHALQEDRAPRETVRRVVELVLELLEERGSCEPGGSCRGG